MYGIGPNDAVRGTTIGKGPVVSVGRGADGRTWDARVVTMVAIYSPIGLRDETMNARLVEALKRSAATLMPRLKQLRRDPHEPGASCWLHGETSCLASEQKHPQLALSPGASASTTDPRWRRAVRAHLHRYNCDVLAGKRSPGVL